MQAAWLIFNIFVIFDCTQGIAKTVLTASGQQKYGAIFTFVAYFTVGIPVSMLMVFYWNVGIWGLWLGPTLACAFNTVVYLIIFKKIDWEELIKKLAIQREKDNVSRLNKVEDTPTETPKHDDDFKKVEENNKV